jgi:hypothetical protein
MRWIGLAALMLAACDGTETEPVLERERLPEREPAVAVAQVCEQFPQSEDDGVATRPKIPAELAAFVTATETTITVQRDSGTPACIDIAYGEVDAWDSLADGRLLGVGISGHEYNSYLVVDRNTSADPLETGAKPVFSHSGRRFASVDVSEAAFGAFEALGVWEVTDTSIRNLATLEELLDRGYDWRLERWVSEDCLVFSTAADPSGVDPETRKFHELSLAERSALRDVQGEDACRAPA